MPKQANWVDDGSLQTAEGVFLSSGFPDSMVILDCETTGGKSSYHRVIEIGLLVVERGNVTKRWQQYINPERPIPSGITRLTGIKQADVSKAPLFEDIADELMEILEGKILVAHNARFDYGFLRNEYSRLEKRYSAKLLCSVKFSRTMFPQFKRHSLDAIIKRFKFTIENRHRAQDDAEMVWQLFQKSTQLFSDDDIEASCEKILKTPTLPVKLDPKEVEKLPNSSGVYYFYDDHGTLLYVGKSINIRNRVLNHFSQDYKNHKDLKMSTRIAHIDYKRTPSDFGAQLLESQQIKKLMPLMNTRLRKLKKLYQLKLTLNEFGYLIPEILSVETDIADPTNHQTSEQFGLFRSQRQINKKLEKLSDQFFLCHRLIGLESGGNNSDKPCFRFQLKRCFGACCQQESPNLYNERITSAFSNYQNKAWPWKSGIIVVEQAQMRNDKNLDEVEPTQHYHLIDNWVYLGKLKSSMDIQDYGYSLKLKTAFDIESSLSSSTNGESAENYAVESNKFLNAQESEIDGFDLDMYFILVRFLFSEEKRRLNHLKVVVLEKDRIYQEI